MISVLKHRGPDALGMWCSPDGRARLGHTRLSVLDLSNAGNQPMVGANGDVALVYNGEIYNFSDLAKDLQGKGVGIASQCDTEVLLQLYLQEGVGCFQRLIGMFAFGIYDARSQALILGRDRAGQKPLYWHQQGNRLLFASELKALCAWPEFDAQIDPEALLNYLQFDYVPTPFSIYKGVFKLLPGHYLIFQNGQVTMKPFWQLHPSHRFLGSYQEGCAQMDAMLDEAVRCRLISDVPLGIFLSGGLDSSTVAYYAVQHHPNIKTFSIAFEDKSYDESDCARLVARHLDTDHEEWTVTASDMLQMLQGDQVPIDEPLGDTSIVPTFLLSQHTRKQVTVALGGDGGDELFAGYPTFFADALSRWVSWMPEVFWRLGLQSIDHLLHPSSRYLSLNFKLKQFVNGMLAQPHHRHQRWLGSFSHEDALTMMHPDLQASLADSAAYAGLKTWAKDIDAWPNGNCHLYEYWRTYLMDEVMVKVDRASMATSLEARAPMLDHRVVALAFSMSYHWKYRWGKGKCLLKDIMKDRLPAEIVDRPKKGFGMPVAQWLKGELTDWAQAHLGRLDDVGISSERAIALHKRHLSGQEDLRKPLWNLIALSLFLQRVHRSDRDRSAV